MLTVEGGDLLVPGTYYVPVGYCLTPATAEWIGLCNNGSNRELLHLNMIVELLFKRSSRVMPSQELHDMFAVPSVSLFYR